MNTIRLAEVNIDKPWRDNDPDGAPKPAAQHDEQTTFDRRQLQPQALQEQWPPYREGGVWDRKGERDCVYVCVCVCVV